MNKKMTKRVTDIAHAICPLNLEHRCSHVAFLIKKNKIVHIATNSIRTHPKTYQFNYKNEKSWNKNKTITLGLHAELAVCIKSGKENLHNYKMVVIRINRHGKIRNSKPCIGCRNVINQFDVGRVWHSTDNESLEQLK